MSWQVDERLRSAPSGEGGVAGATQATTSPTQDFYFNPWDAAFRDNPYPHYRPLLAKGPSLLDWGAPVALVARYADVVAVLNDHRRFSSLQPRSYITERRIEAFGQVPNLLFSDPPTHTRLRRLVGRAFTARGIQALERRINEITSYLLDAAVHRGRTVEIMTDLANPLPVIVISEILGISPGDYRRFKSWSDLIIEADNVEPGREIPAPIRTAFGELVEFFKCEIERRRLAPSSDLVSLLAAASPEALSAEELVAFLVLLLLAGNETTTNLIGNGLLALLSNPREMARLRACSALLPSGIEEMLRYDSPAQAAVRFARADATVGGVTIKAGTFVFVLLAAANRDPEKFASPEQFDVSRSPNEHVAFGVGIHHCLGAPLARLEGAIAFESLLRRFPAMRLAGDGEPLSYKGSYFLRGLAALRVATSGCAEARGRRT